jgi:hypothetical protein
MKVQTDCNQRPEGVTPLIFWEWLSTAPKGVSRQIIHRKWSREENAEFTWRAHQESVNFPAENTNSKHATAGGLAAQLRPFTSFKEQTEPTNWPLSLVEALTTPLDYQISYDMLGWSLKHIESPFSLLITRAEAMQFEQAMEVVNAGLHE